jgi:LuxR family transcriptional regulator, maltose regulon positive regulatory protein
MKSDSPLAFARLRARNQITELRARDLRFTLEESSQFFQQVIGSDLTADQVKVLEERTEGWAAGLQRAGLSLQGKKILEPHPILFGQQHIYSGLPGGRSAPVTSRRMGGIHAPYEHFRSSDGPFMSSSDRAGIQPALLEQLQHANLFLFPLDNERQWYRYHHFFADFLRRRLIHQESEKVEILHLTASRWFEEHGLLSEAVQHALSAGNFDRVAALIELLNLEAGRHSDYHWIVK